MKQCEYCGKKYPDNATICVIDENPLVPVKPNRASQPAAPTWLDKQFLMKSGGFGGQYWNFPFFLSIVGVLGCKHPAARKKAWAGFGLQLILLLVALVVVIIIKRR